MKRHLFSLLVFSLCVLGWALVLKGGVQTAPVMAEPEVNMEESAKTQILGESTHSLAGAKEWAAARGATDDFIAAADIYWKIGELMGIRADVMYAQSAKETAFGNYTGNVTKDQNNFAGIKKVNATGDTRDDHETFSNSEAGVQGHFNHMAAYCGAEPLGMLHQRYYTVLSTGWAGNIKHVEDLSEKWAPAEDYGKSIVNDYLNTMGENK
ncbi:MAG: glucosaminidase domain-containing protein [Oscillospiraceae bacterium]|nr:glucosaminidase domain-containing protein [Oscillospiraceae bacterium]